MKHSDRPTVGKRGGRCIPTFLPSPTPRLGALQNVSLTRQMPWHTTAEKIKYNNPNKISGPEMVGWAGPPIGAGTSGRGGGYKGCDPPSGDGPFTNLGIPVGSRSLGFLGRRISAFSEWVEACLAVTRSHTLFAFTSGKEGIVTFGRNWCCHFYVGDFNF